MVIDDNFDRWPEEDIIGGDNWVLAFLNGCPTYTWDDSYQEVEDWVVDRVIWMDNNVDNYPF